MSKYTEICPSCSADDGHLIGTGENFILYYSCDSCGHHFIIDATEYINEDEEINNEELLQDSSPEIY